jgi:WD40 repeat protein
VSGSNNGLIWVWDAYTGKPLGAPLQGHTEKVNSVVISQDGNLIVSGSDDQTIRVWDIMTGEALDAPCRLSNRVVSVAISPDGKRIVSLAGSRGDEDYDQIICVHVWNTVTGWALDILLQGHTGSLQSTTHISPDGKRILAVSGQYTIEKMIYVWDAVTGQSLGPPLQRHTLDYLHAALAISLDGKHIASESSSGNIRIWDAESGEAVGTPLRGHTGIYWGMFTFAISLDENYVVGSDGGKILIWNMETGEALCAPFLWGTEYVHSITISPDGKRIVTGSHDGAIRVWDLESLIQSQSFETAIHFSSNLTHALRSASSFLQDLHTPVSSILTNERWMVGPEGRLLLWISTPLYPVMYQPGNTLVMPNDALQLDLSHFAHGMSWHKCREHDGTASL